MAKQKKRSKAYKPKTVNPNSMNWAFSGTYTLPMDKQKDLVGYVDDAITLLRLGRASRENWNTIANGMNIAEALAYFEIGPNLMSEINAAQDALHAIAMRMIKTGSSTCYASELAAISEGREMYKIQLGLCSQAECGNAVKRVQNLHRSGGMRDMGKIYQAMGTQ